MARLDLYMASLDLYMASLDLYMARLDLYMASLDADALLSNIQSDETTDIYVKKFFQNPKTLVK